MRVLLTGATGSMGINALNELNKNKDYIIRVFVHPTKNDCKIIKKYESCSNIEIVYGDITNYNDVIGVVKDCDMILHVAALVSPQADYNPKLAMKINFGGTKNLIDALKELNMNDTCKFVYIGTVAETGDRMPPIHWGRVGDPIKPSFYDYYAVSKVAAERYVIESDVKNWVSLRQTGMLCNAMCNIRDAIIFHMCLDNVLEYISDRDSGLMLSNLWNYDLNKKLPAEFWNHIYNVGGGESCRIDTYNLFKTLYGKIGIKKLEYVIDPKLYATKNFHGQYYLDSDVLESYLNFRRDSIEYFYDLYLKYLGPLVPLSKVICKLPLGQRLMGAIIKGSFRKILKSEHSPKKIIKEHQKEQIIAFWGEYKNWEKIPKNLNHFKHFTDWDKVFPISHGYNEDKRASEIDINDLKDAAKYRGGHCLSNTMIKGDLKTKLRFKCAFNHEFDASPRLVLEGGHWCPICERMSWNYYELAKVSPFIASVWNPLHSKSERGFEYKKIVDELNYD